jgi:tRNA(Ile)-lysidine synthase
MTSNNFAERVLATVDRHKMILGGEDVSVALSGGADSVALLLVLHEAAGRRGWNINALHINHRLRGDESLRDENFCRTLCQKLGVPLLVSSVDVKGYVWRNRRFGEEEAARILRYRELDRLAAGKIATAHTLSDSVETLFLNLTRGTGIKGLAGIPYSRGRIVRPLIEVTRGAVEQYCREKEQFFVTDSTNESTVYIRNKIRLEIIPIFKEINPSLEETIARLMRLAAADAAFLDDTALKAYDACLSGQGLDTEKMKGLEDAVRTRALAIFLKRAGLSADEKTTVAADRLLARKGGSFQASRDVMIVNRRGILSAEQPAAMPVPGYLRSVWLLPAVRVIRLRLPGERWLAVTALGPDEIKLFVNYIPLEFQNALDCDKIGKCIQLRTRRPKDSLRQWGRGLTKTLKKLAGELGISPSKRHCLAVLADEEGVIWAEKFGVAQRAALTIETKKAVLIEIDGE